MTSSAAVPACQVRLHRKVLLARQAYELWVMPTACYSTLTDTYRAACAVAPHLARACLELLAVLSLASAKADVRHPRRGRVSRVPKVASLASRCTQSTAGGRLLEAARWLGSLCKCQRKAGPCLRCSPVATRHCLAALRLLGALCCNAGSGQQQLLASSKPAPLTPGWSATTISSGHCSRDKA